MTKEKVFELLNNAISHIGANFNSDEVESYLNDQLTEGNFPVGEYSIDSGISKAVIIIQGAPFVIKMPFFTIYESSTYDEDLRSWEQGLDEAINEYAKKRVIETGNEENYILTHEELQLIRKQYKEYNPEPTTEDYYYEIEGASNINLGDNIEPAIPDWDYCRLESVIYQLAVEEGLGAYFAEEGYLGTIDQTPIYYQTRCIPMSSITIDYRSKEYAQKESKSKSICDKLQIPCFDEVWISDFIDCYGEEEFKRLNSFLNRYEIEDLRRCNIGYLDNAPILFDYSGYRDW